MTRITFGPAAALLVLAGAAGADDKPTIDDVKKAWKARQEAHKRFRVEWAEAATIKAGSYPDDSPRYPEPHPRQDTELKALGSFAANGDQSASAREGAAYRPSNTDFVPYSHAAYFDGTAHVRIRTSLSQPGWMQATVSTGGNDLTVLHSTENDAVTRLLRPLGGGALPAFNFDGFELHAGEKIGGTACVELRKVAGGSRYSIWCDPEREFRPVRESRQSEGGAGRVLDWKYAKGGKAGVLNGWEVKRTDKGGAVHFVFKAEVKTLDLAPKFAADAFAPKPPRMSEVTAYADGAEKERYLVRADGSNRQVTIEELVNSYDELAETNADGTPYVPAKK